jgi:hypothetical protein
MRSPLVGFVLGVGLLIGIIAGPAQADPLTNEVLKFFQIPLNNGLVLLPPGAVFPPASVPAPWPGHDEFSTAYRLAPTGPGTNIYNGTYMADDFCDYQSTPIVHVMWWGSYSNNIYAGGVPRFLIAFESDVAAGSPSNTVPYSHPGTNIVSQIVTRGPLAPRSGTFTELLMPIGPGPANPDGNLYQYNAELAIPVPEQSNQVMWLKIVALSTNSVIQWGWHNRDYGIWDPLACTPPGVVPGEFNIGPPEMPIWHFQDDAVTGPVTVFLSPVTNIVTLVQTNWFPTFYLPSYDGINYSKDLAFALYTETSHCPPPPTNSPTKWIQYPDLTNGMNVRATAPKILADDFLCTTNGPVTDIHIWGSWLFDQFGIITNFHISFHADIPAGGTITYSRPGQELWSADFAYGEFTESFYTNSFEYFFDPNVNQIIGTDQTVFRYDFLVDPCKAFVQTNGVIYWMDVQVYTVNGTFGWKSSGTHCYDDAVWGDTPEPFWNELRYPPGHLLEGQSFDLAFELTTTQPTNFPTKWIEYPDLVYGMNVLDVAPKILGDDFQCALTGPITDIHIWGSWLNDQIGAITNMYLAIYSDAPATNYPYSRPANLLWATNYFAGQFSQQFWTNSNEYFFNPNINQIVGGDSLVFRYNFCIDPAMAFIQTNGVIYWLVAQAYTTNGVFGWKSSGTHCFDDAVWGDTPTPIFWQELRYPPGHPLQGQSFDLAFEITTPIPFATWQVAYFGSTTCTLCSATADFDGDGASNTNEYLAGTVPTNNASFLRVTSIARTGVGSNDITLTWTTVGGHSYIVQTNRPPASGDYTNNFSDLSVVLTAPGPGESTLSYNESGTATNRPTRFYRVRQIQLCQ